MGFEGAREEGVGGPPEEEERAEEHCCGEAVVDPGKAICTVLFVHRLAVARAQVAKGRKKRAYNLLQTINWTSI